MVNNAKSLLRRTPIRFFSPTALGDVQELLAVTQCWRLKIISFPPDFQISLANHLFCARLGRARGCWAPDGWPGGCHGGTAQAGPSPVLGNIWKPSQSPANLKETWRHRQYGLKSSYRIAWNESAPELRSSARWSGSFGPRAETGPGGALNGTNGSSFITTIKGNDVNLT